MKLTGIEKPIKNFAGEAIQQEDGSELTVKDCLLNCLARMKADTGKESIHVYSLGTDIHKAKGECPIESADMALLKHAVEQNGMGYFSLIQGQAFAYLEEIDTADKKEDK